MKAKEAREIAENKIKTEHRECFDKIMEDIKINSKHGYFEFTNFNKMPKSVEEELKQLGYKVERRDAGRNEIDVIISW